MDINAPSSSQQMSDIFIFSFAVLLAGAVNFFMLPTSIARGNVPGIFANTWLFFSNILQAINTVIPGDVLIHNPVFCDIGMVKFKAYISCRSLTS